MAITPELPDEGSIQVGDFLVPCEECGLRVPMSVIAFVGIDDEGDECIFTEIITVDFEAHLLTHAVCYEVTSDDN